MSTRIGGPGVPNPSAQRIADSQNRLRALSPELAALIDEQRAMAPAPQAPAQAPAQAAPAAAQSGQAAPTLEQRREVVQSRMDAIFERGRELQGVLDSTIQSIQNGGVAGLPSLDLGGVFAPPPGAEAPAGTPAPAAAAAPAGAQNIEQAKAEQAEQEKKSNRAEDKGLEFERVNEANERVQGLIGLPGMKDYAKGIKASARAKALDAKLGIVEKPGFQHIMLVGPPGCGKTFSAKIVGEEIAGSGLIKAMTDEELETYFRLSQKKDDAAVDGGDANLYDPSKLPDGAELNVRGDVLLTGPDNFKSGYKGQSGLKTQNVFDFCYQQGVKVLIVDEAYTISSGPQDEFGQDAVTAIIRNMGNRPENLCVILIGYKDQTVGSLAGTNEGTLSRLTIVELEPKTRDELRLMLGQKIPKGMNAADADLDMLADALYARHDNPGYGDVRDLEVCMSTAMKHRNIRLDEQYPTEEAYLNMPEEAAREIAREDLQYGLELLQKKDSIVADATGKGSEVDLDKLMREFGLDDEEKKKLTSATDPAKSAQFNTFVDALKQPTDEEKAKAEQEQKV